MDSHEQTTLPAYHTPEEILSHPRLAIARRAYVREILKIYEHDPSLNLQASERGGAGRRLVQPPLSLHAAFVESNRATWPTMRRLQQTVAMFGVSSARRVNDIIAQFVAAGFVESRVAPSDRRARILEPTAKLIAHDFEWLSANYAPLDVLFPSPGYALPLKRESSLSESPSHHRQSDGGPWRENRRI